MRKPKVYVTNNKDYDLSGAAVYGDIEVIYPSKPPNIFNTSSHAFHIREALKDAQSSDYLLISGSMLLVILAWGVLYEKFGFVNVLLFDVRTSEYTARVIPRHQLQSKGKE